MSDGRDGAVVSLTWARKGEHDCGSCADLQCFRTGKCQRDEPTQKIAVPAPAVVAADSPLGQDLAEALKRIMEDPSEDLLTAFADAVIT